MLNERRVRWSSDVSVADWIVQRLSGAEGTVGSVVPAGFAAYGRIDHTLDNGDPPVQGSLPPDLAAALAGVVADFTTTADRCWFGIWDGYGWLYGGKSVRMLAREGEASRDLPPKTASVKTGPRVRLPFRDYLLYGGPISGVTAFTGYPTNQTPNLWWPDDRSWFVATDIDLPVTYIGGSAALIDRIVADPRFLNARRVDLGDALD